MKSLILVLFVVFAFPSCADLVDCSPVDGNHIDGRITPFMSLCDIEYGDVIYLKSGGGFVLSAIEISDNIKETQTDTFVSELCGSACTLIVASGKERFMCSDAIIGLHRGSDPYADSLLYNYLAEDERVNEEAVWQIMAQAPYWDITFQETGEHIEISAEESAALGLIDHIVNCGD